MDRFYTSGRHLCLAKQTQMSKNVPNRKIKVKIKSRRTHLFFEKVSEILITFFWGGGVGGGGGGLRCGMLMLFCHKKKKKICIDYDLDTL